MDPNYTPRLKAHSKVEIKRPFTRIEEQSIESKQSSPTITHHLLKNQSPQDDMLILQNGQQSIPFVETSAFDRMKQVSCSGSQLGNMIGYESTMRYSLEDITIVSKRDIARHGSKLVNHCKKEPSQTSRVPSKLRGGPRG